MEYNSFEGKVISSSTNLPIVDAVVTICYSDFEVNDIASLSDENGYFSIDVPANGICHISINAENFEDFEVDITEKRDQFIEIYLD